MLNENIKRFRKEKGFSQEELAVKLNVVRQTVSKWENGLSVPDAELLIQMAELLEVPVSQLLGLGENKEEENSLSAEALSEELARVNELLAKKVKREKLVTEADKKRNLILFLTFVSLVLILLVKNEVISIVLVGICMLAAVIILYGNLALLTSVTTEDLNLKPLRISTIFSIAVFVICFVFAVLTEADGVGISENAEKLFSIVLISGLMIFSGIMGPKTPYNRYVGLRLPWTIRDEETWNVAHRILGYISVPMALLYLAGALTISDFEMVTLAAMMLWIGVPGGISLLFFSKKTRGR